MNDFQSIAALVIVISTTALYLIRSFQRNSNSCGGNCGCPAQARVNSRK